MILYKSWKPFGLKENGDSDNDNVILYDVAVFVKLAIIVAFMLFFT